MKRRWKTWKKFLLPASGIIFGGTLLFLLEETIRLKNAGFETKTLWDWMELFIIPLFLAGGAFYLNRSERITDRGIATDRQKEEALQTYINQMADLLLKEKMRTSENGEVRNVARTRTLSVLRGLDNTRKGTVLKFLYEAGLIAKEKTIVDLKGADLSGADLVFADLRGANLSGAFFWEADLSEADLSGADLRGTDFTDAILKDTNLSNANLRDAYLGWSFLFRTNLSGADLSTTKLDPARLEYADLSGAILPDGIKHE